MYGLTHDQSEQYNKYNYFFSIIYRGVYDGRVNYYIEYGKNEDHSGHTKEFINKYRVVLRFSELRRCNILLKHFPPRTFFYYTDDKFIGSRVKGFKYWVSRILEQGKASDLFQFLEGERIKQAASGSRMCFGILSEESD